MRCVATLLISSWLALPSSFAQINPSSFAQTNSVVSLVFAGDTTLDDDAGDLIAKGGDPFAAFESFFAKADITIVPSLCYENSPTVIFESFSYHTPVLASNIEGIAELIKEGENGLTFIAGNEASLLQKLQ